MDHFLRLLKWPTYRVGSHSSDLVLLQQEYKLEAGFLPNQTRWEANDQWEILCSWHSQRELQCNHSTILPHSKDKCQHSRQILGRFSPGINLTARKGYNQEEWVLNNALLGTLITSEMPHRCTQIALRKHNLISRARRVTFNPHRPVFKTHSLDFMAHNRDFKARNRDFKALSKLTQHRLHLYRAMRQLMLRLRRKGDLRSSIAEPLREDQHNL